MKYSGCTKTSITSLPSIISFKRCLTNNRPNKTRISINWAFYLNYSCQDWIHSIQNFPKIWIVTQLNPRGTAWNASKEKPNLGIWTSWLILLEKIFGLDLSSWCLSRYSGWVREVFESEHSFILATKT